MDKYVVAEVGKRYRKNCPAPNEDFGQFEYDEAGFTMVACLNSPTFFEIEAFHDSVLSTKAICENDMVLAGVHFGNAFQFEIEFDPTICDKEVANFDNGNLVTFLLIDSRTNIVIGIRRANMPFLLRTKWLNSWSKAFEDSNFSAKYKNWVRSLTSRYTVEELWVKYAIPTGEFGEYYPTFGI